jgi:hypothetical protein
MSPVCPRGASSVVRSGRGCFLRSVLRSVVVALARPVVRLPLRTEAAVGLEPSLLVPTVRSAFRHRTAGIPRPALRARCRARRRGGVPLLVDGQWKAALQGPRKAAGPTTGGWRRGRPSRVARNPALAHRRSLCRSSIIRRLRPGFGGDLRALRSGGKAAIVAGLAAHAMSAGEGEALAPQGGFAGRRPSGLCLGVLFVALSVFGHFPVPSPSLRSREPVYVLRPSPTLVGLEACRERPFGGGHRRKVSRQGFVDTPRYFPRKVALNLKKVTCNFDH